MKDEVVYETVAACGARGLDGVDSHDEGRRRVATVNRLVLMMARSKSPVLRLRVIRCAEVLAKKIGEEYLSTLPETIPFLAELIEDEDTAVETATREFVSFLEELSGEEIMSQLKE